jgi:hypothetical protein
MILILWPKTLSDLDASGKNRILRAEEVQMGIRKEVDKGSANKHNAIFDNGGRRTGSLGYKSGPGLRGRKRDQTSEMRYDQKRGECTWAC